MPNKTLEDVYGAAAPDVQGIIHSAADAIDRFTEDELEAWAEEQARNQEKK